MKKLHGKNQIAKTFSIDRTCAVELETDAVNGYFELPNPVDRGELRKEPNCYERWNLRDNETYDFFVNMGKGLFA